MEKKLTIADSVSDYLLKKLLLLPKIKNSPTNPKQFLNIVISGMMFLHISLKLSAVCRLGITFHKKYCSLSDNIPTEQGYRREFGKLRPFDEFSSFTLSSGDGGMRSTARDMSLWIDAQLGHTELPEKRAA